MTSPCFIAILYVWHHLGASAQFCDASRGACEDSSAESLLQIGSSVRSNIQTRESALGTEWSAVGDVAGSSGFELIFVTDCTSHQRWMAFNVFNSARSAGQTDPISWIRAGNCSSTGRQDAKTALALYPKARVVNLPGGEQGNFNLAGGVPRAVQNYLDMYQSMDNSTVVALIEGDMIFLSPLRIDDLETRGLHMNVEGQRPAWRTSSGHEVIRHEGALVGGHVGVAAHYTCCENLGPPYILSMQGWRHFTPYWNSAFETGGWGGDQIAFGQAAVKAGVQFNVYEHLMVSSFDTMPAGWALVDKAAQSSAADVCTTKKVGEQAGVEQLPTFLHVCMSWVARGGSSSLSDQWGFGKYQVPPGWGKKRPHQTDGILDCGMPLFAEPPQTLMQTNGSESREGWVVCTILHSLNDMLFNYKTARCPAGFNDAKALKMNVHEGQKLEWDNSLLQNAFSAAPSGTDTNLMRRCAENTEC